MLSQSTDINECLIGTDNCNDSAECTDTVGGYNCTCAVGFEWDGRTCSSKLHVKWISLLVDTANFCDVLKSTVFVY